VYMRFLSAFIFFLFSSFSFSQSTNEIKGTANDYAGKLLRVYATDDYLSNVRTQIASTEVSLNGEFSTTFYNNEIRKLIVEVGNDQFVLYAQPNTQYQLVVEKDERYSFRGGKGDAGFYFVHLDTNDINYKILIFEDYQLNFLENYYNRNTLKTPEFVSRLDTFKINIENRYRADTNSFFKTYVRYSIASLDNLAFTGQRNEYEKYDFYIKPYTVEYQNDRYIDYIKHYYKQYETQLSDEVEREFYKGIIRSSPTLLMNALGGDYALKNLRLREFILINMLSEIFYSDQYPKTNIITVLDSISNHALFNEHKKVASNIKFRLTDLKPGTLMPDFNVIIKGQRKFKSDYANKFLYIQFVDNEVPSSINDLRLMVPLYQKYNKYIEFLTILVDRSGKVANNTSDFIKEHQISWDFSVIDNNNDIINKMNVSSFPYYILMDATGYVVGAPASTPRPNNEYETIEKELHLITRRYKAMESNDRGY